MTCSLRVAALLFGFAAVVASDGCDGAALPEATPSSRQGGRGSIDAYNRGIDLYRSGQFEQAVTQFAEAVTSMPSRAQRALADYNLGAALFRRGDLQGSLGAFRDSLLLNPDDEDARYNYAFVKARIEREARQDRPQSKPPVQSEADRLLGTFGAPNMGTHRREERSVRPAKDW